MHFHINRDEELDIVDITYFSTMAITFIYFVLVVVVMVIL